MTVLTEEVLLNDLQDPMQRLRTIEAETRAYLENHPVGSSNVDEVTGVTAVRRVSEIVVELLPIYVAVCDTIEQELPEYKLRLLLECVSPTMGACAIGLHVVWDRMNAELKKGASPVEVWEKLGKGFLLKEGAVFDRLFNCFKGLEAFDAAEALGFHPQTINIETGQAILENGVPFTCFGHIF